MMKLAIVFVATTISCVATLAHAQRNRPPIIVSPSIISPSIISPSIISPSIISPSILRTRAPSPSPSASPSASPNASPYYSTPNSHLVCHAARIKSSEVSDYIKVSLQANDKQKKFGLRNCEVLTRYVELCVPATKIVHEGYNMPKVIKDLKPPALETDFICYYLRCPRQSHSPGGWKVALQFGLLKLSFPPLATRKRICIPAWKLLNGRPVFVE